MNEQTRPTRLASPSEEFAQAHPAPSHQPPAVREPTADIEPTVKREPSRTVPFASGGFGKVIEGIAGVMAEIRPVEKLGYNKFHGYHHARIGDLNAELTPLMGKHGIVVFQNEVRRDMFDNGAVVSIQYEFTIVHKSGEVWPERPVISGMARCRTQKESFDDKTFNKCHTAARKYFLIGLFQIPVSDEDDADDSEGGSGAPRERSRPTRRPPSPDGKATPAVVPIEGGELPNAWAERFKKLCGTSADLVTVNKWYEANIAIFEKIRKFKDDVIDGAAVYNDLIGFMDDLEVRLMGGEKPKPNTITTGPQPQDEDAAEPTKPRPRQRRAAPPPPAEEEATEATDETKLWLESLENAFGACADAEQLAEAQMKHMTEAKKAEVSQEAWADAVKIVRTHLARVTG